MEWTKGRLDDAFEEIRRRLDETFAELRKRLDRLEDVDLHIQMAELAVYVKGVHEDVEECRKMWERLDANLTNQREKDRQEREQRILQVQAERKSDRRWLTGTILTASGLVVAAIGVLADKI